MLAPAMPSAAVAAAAEYLLTSAPIIVVLPQPGDACTTMWSSLESIIACWSASNLISITPAAFAAMMLSIMPALASDTGHPRLRPIFLISSNDLHSYSFLAAFISARVFVSSAVILPISSFNSVTLRAFIPQGVNGLP